MPLIKVMRCPVSYDVGYAPRIMDVPCAPDVHRNVLAEVLMANLH